MRILIVDDEPKVRQLIRALLDGIPEVEIAGESSDGREAMTLIGAVQPDLVLTDIRMPDIDGLSLVKYTKQNYPQVHIVVISGYSQFEYAKQAIAYGVDDYLLKPIKKLELLEIIERVRNKISVQKKHSINVAKSFISILLYDPERIRGTLTQEELAIHFAHTPKDNGFYIVTLFKIDSQILGQDEKILAHIMQKASVIVRNMVSLRAGLPCCVGTDKNGICCLVTYLDESELPALHKALQNAIFSIKVICENTADVYVTAAMSKTVDSPSELVDAMESAQRVMENRLVLGCNRILEPQMETSLFSVRDFISPSVQKQLLENSEQANWQSVQDIIDSIGSQILNTADVTGTIAWQVGLKIARLLVFSLHVQLNDAEQNQLLKHFEQRLWMCNNVNAIFKEIDRLLTQEILPMIEGKKEKELRPISQARQYIRMHYAEQLTLEDVSAEVHLQPNYFSGLFKKETGQTFVEYLTEVRVSSAKNMLVNTAEQVDMIALAVGYRDPKHFSKVFKKLTKLTPLEYRNLYC